MNLHRLTLLPLTAWAALSLAPAVAAPPADIVDIAVGSKDHTTLVAAVKAADYVVSLKNPGPLTVFAPTDAAFAKLPKEAVARLLEPAQRGELEKLLQHHVTTSVYEVKWLKDGQKLGQADGTKVTITVKDGKTYVDGALIVASVRASNGIVHDPVGGADRGHDERAVHVGLAVLHGDGDLRAVGLAELLAVLEPLHLVHGRRHVVLQQLLQLAALRGLEQARHRLLGQLGERGIGGREHRERPGVLERHDVVGRLHRGDQRGVVLGSHGDVDDVGRRCGHGRGEAQRGPGGQRQEGEAVQVHRRFLRGVAPSWGASPVMASGSREPGELRVRVVVRTCGAARPRRCACRSRWGAARRRSAPASPSPCPGARAPRRPPRPAGGHHASAA